MKSKYLVRGGFILVVNLLWPAMSFAVEKVGAAASGSVPAGVSAGSLLQVTLGLLVVLLVIIGIAWILRRYGRFQSSASGSLKIMGGLSIGPRERVVLLQVGEEQLLIGVAPGRVQALHHLKHPVRLTPSSPNESPENLFGKRVAGDARGFAERLSLAIKQRKQS